MTNTFVIIIFMIVPNVLYGGRIEQLVTVSQFQNICMKGKNHKLVPSPEPDLGHHMSECALWSERSCCTGSVLSKDTAFRFNYHHCKTMSDKCLKHFKIDYCLYECSPNLGPWLVKESGILMRSERFFGAPLCYEDCNNWWNDCKNEWTCAVDWTRGFKWKKGMNHCLKNDSCNTIQNIYKSKEHFCEVIHGGSWKVAKPGDKDCFYMGVNATKKDLITQNEAVMLRRAKKIVQKLNSSMKLSLHSILVTLLCAVNMAYYLLV